MQILSRSGGRTHTPRGDAPIAGVRLLPEEIALDVGARDRDSLFAIAAYYIARAHGIGSIPIARALLRREAAASTALGFGIAIPHARIEGITVPLTLFLRTKRPIPFRAPDGKDVSNFLIIMVPTSGDTDAHLQLLASVATRCGDPDFRAQLSAATTAQQVQDAFAGETMPGARTYSKE